MLYPAGPHALQTACPQATFEAASATMQEPAHVCLGSVLGTQFQSLPQIKFHAGHHVHLTVCKAAMSAVAFALPMGELYLERPQTDSMLTVVTQHLLLPRRCQGAFT